MLPPSPTSPPTPRPSAAASAAAWPLPRRASGLKPSPPLPARYTGNTTLNGGTLILGANAAFSTNGPLGNNANPIFLGDPVNGNNTSLFENGAFTVSRDLSILGTSGTITLGSNGTFNPTFSGNLLGLNRDLILTEGGTVANFDTVNFANGITGGGNLTVQGTGQTFLQGNNTFTGNTVVLSGELATGQQFSVGNSSAIFVGDTSGANAAALESNFNGVAFTQNITVRSGSSGNTTLGVNNVTTGVGNTTTFASNITLNKDAILGGSTNANMGVVFNGVISGSSNVTVTGISSETVTLNGTNTYTGNTAILSGTVLVGANVTPGQADRLGNATYTVLLGDYTGSTNSNLVSNGAFTVSRNILARFGNSGTETIGGTTANPSTFSGNVELNHNLVLNQFAGGTANFTGNFTALSGVTSARPAAAPFCWPAPTPTPATPPSATARSARVGHGPAHHHGGGLLGPHRYPPHQHRRLRPDRRLVPGGNATPATSAWAATTSVGTNNLTGWPTPATSAAAAT